jgi:hypothetical protein
MSLQHVAKHLTEQGRGPDDHLVHMSGKEVAGLQALAMAHGGSLTINPKTGLPEAGFLDDILPTLAIGAGIYASIYGMPDFSSMSSMFPSAAAAGEAGVASITPSIPSLPTSEIAPLYADYGQAVGSQSFLSSSPLAAANAAAGGGSGLLAGMGQYALPVAGGVAALSLLNGKKAEPSDKTKPMIRPHTYTYNPQRPNNMIGSQYQPYQDTSERTWFSPQWQAGTPYEAADGGIIALADGGMAAGGGPVEQMSNQAAMGANTMYPMANMATSSFATPYQSPVSTNMLAPTSDSGVGMNGEPNMQGTRMAAGGLSDLGGYSDGGRLLRGPGDGVSDSIPAQIGNKQPARLADGEFVVPARIVSELGNGSTEAGAKQLYKMLDRVQNARGKTTAKGKVAKNTNAAKLLPA